jgi:hypothetical protein
LSLAMKTPHKLPLTQAGRLSRLLMKEGQMT